MPTAHCLQLQRENSEERYRLLEEEVSLQEELQLTVKLDDELLDLPNLPCSGNLMNDTSDAEHQDAIQIDDSVSNVTADDRVGFESKEGSSFDENSLTEEVVEVCDAACQTEFTDSDTLSVQSNGIHVDSNVDKGTLHMTTNSVNRNLHRQQATEAFLNATLQGTLLRKPDGASDPSLHKELLSPTGDRKHVDPMVQSSNTLPRDAYRKAPTNTPSHDVLTIKLQPYLSTPSHSSNSTTTTAIPTTSKQAQPTLASPERATSKSESKLKKLNPFRLQSNDGPETIKAANTSSGKKSKGSKLPGLRLSSKPKDTKPSTSGSATPKKSEPAKKVHCKIKRCSNAASCTCLVLYSSYFVFSP